MNTPTFLLGFSIIFWGWQTGHWIWAIGLTLLSEGSWFFKYRYEWSDSDVRRTSDFSTLIFVILFIYLLFKEGSASIIIIFQWLPIIFSPLLAIQVYSTANMIDIRSLFLTLRRKTKKGEKQNPIMFNLKYPYFAVCILSASAANQRDVLFYVTLFLFSLWIFWNTRPKRYSTVTFLLIFILAGGTGFAGSYGLHHFQLFLERKSLEWFDQVGRGDPDPFKTRTAIGDIGSLKPSNKIVFKVQGKSRKLFPILLQEASYDIYNHSMWIATRPDVKTLKSNHNKSTWYLDKGTNETAKITIFSYFSKGEGILKLPPSPFQVENLPVERMDRNRFGTIKVDGAPGFGAYDILFNRLNKHNDIPTEYDLHVPNREKGILINIVNNLGINGKSPHEILRYIEDFFKKNFKYSLVQKERKISGTHLGNFLTRSKKGHCEYFATAAVLILRTAGIPARYAKGYSVSEYSGLEKRFLVRDRDAHSWALAYLDGKWLNFDVTPASWGSLENGSITLWNRITDMWSLCMFTFSEWLWMKEKRFLLNYIWWISIPILYFIYFVARRLLPKRNIISRRKTHHSQKTHSKNFPGLDSEFYILENELKGLNEVRDESVTLKCWVKKIQNDHPDVNLFKELEPILELHYRYRFDPKGISSAERETLCESVDSWINHYNKLGIQSFGH